MNRFFWAKSWKYKKVKNNKGALTIEATLAFPIFLFAVLSIAFFTRVVYIQNQVQMSLNQAAIDLSTLSYIYYMTGLKDHIDETQDTISETSEGAEQRVSTVLDIYSSMQKGSDEVENIANDVYEGDIADDVLEGNFEEVLGSFEDIVDVGEDMAGSIDDLENMLEEMFEDPEKEMINMLALIADGGMDIVNQYVGGILARTIMNKHVDQSIFRKTNLGAYIVNDDNEGIKSLDFTGTSLFRDDDKQNIDLIVNYTVDIKLPINFLPNLNFQQRSTMRGYTKGDGTSNRPRTFF